MPNLAKDKLCTGCMACKDVCPRNAISIAYKNGLTFPSVNHNLCVECRGCEKVCPIITLVDKNGVENMHVYGGWAKDDNTRINGASGGAFSGLAHSFVIQHRGEVAVYGACLNDNRVKHIRVDSLDNLPLLMNSKYIQSSTEGIYRQIKNDILSGIWVLFSGTPCQVAGVYGYLGKLRNYEKLLTVELVCHGVPGNEALDIHLHHFNSPRILSFRNKEEGQFWYKSQCTTIIRDGVPFRFNRQDDVFYKIYSGWLLDRKSCSNCQYSSLERVADITLADFWGGAKSEDEYIKGVNVIITNNIKADTIVKGSKDLFIYSSTLSKVINGNANMYNGFKYIQYHPFVMWPTFFRKVLPKRIWLQVVENRMPWKLLWAIYKMLTILHSKRLKKSILIKYESVLCSE